MKAIRFLFILAALSLGLQASAESIGSMWVGDNYTIYAPTTIRLSSGDWSLGNYRWEGIDPAFFNVEFPDTYHKAATITLKAPFQGEKTIKCTADYTYYSNSGGTPKYGTTSYTYTITCNQVDVALYPVQMTLEQGDSQTLQWQFSHATTPAAEITFASSDNNVAMVDFNGKVTAMGVGNATITATTNYGTTATCEVTVNPILATSVTLDKPSLNIPVGSTQTLKATVLPTAATDKSVTWTSSDENVATVDANGKVTAKAIGVATVTAMTNDGSDLSAECAVTVSAVKPLAMTLDLTETELHVGESVRLTASVMPAAASQRVRWSSSDPTVAKVVGGTVYALEWGECVITATSLDDATVTADCIVMVLPESQGGNNADVNRDGEVNAADLNIVIDTILGK